jgi:Nucleoside phosphorylase
VEKEPLTRVLIAVASPGECKFVLAGLGLTDVEVPALWQAMTVSPRLSILHTGVGKTNAAAAVAKELAIANGNASAPCHGGATDSPGHGAARGARPYSAVLNIGVAGSYDPSIGLGSSVLGLKHWMLDEGTIVDREPGWTSIEEAGWATVSVEPVAGELHEFFKTLADHSADVGTISTISGTTAIRDAYLKRAPVKIETMESCSIALVCSMFSIEYVDVRVISNFCGERTSDNHDFPGALKKISAIMERSRSLFSLSETVSQ